MRDRTARPVAALLAVLAAALASASVAFAVELPDQLQTDFPGLPPGNAKGDRGRTGPAPSTGFESDTSRDPFRGVTPGGQPREGTGDLSLGSAGLGTEGGAGTTGLGTRYGPTRPESLPDKLEIRGNYTARLSGQSVSGNADAYGQQFSDTRPLDHQASVTVNGRLLSGFPLYMRASAQIRPYSPTNLDWTFIWHERNVDVTYGDTRSGFSRNSFASIARATKGLTVVGDIGTQGRFQLFGTESRGITRRDTIPGEGSAGPYYLRNAPIREETIHVRIDNQDISRDRYRLDPDQGVLTFLDMVVPQSSVIEAVYEENRAGSARGLYYGLVTDYRFGKVPVSITYISQDISGGATSTGQSVLRTEEFFANNSTGPFLLSYRPIDTAHPIVAFVDGLPKTMNVDFVFVPQSGTVQFYNIVPATSVVRVDYYSFETQSRPDSKKRLIGFDTGYQWGNFDVGTSIATSTGGLLPDGSPAPGGSAFDVRLGYRAPNGKLNGVTKYQHQDSGFSRVESTSFDSDSSGWDTMWNYTPSRDISSYFRYSSGVSRQGLSLGSSGIGTSTEAQGLSYRNEQLSVGGDWRYRPQGGRLTVALNRDRSGMPNGAQSTRDMGSAAWADTFGSISASAGVTLQNRTSLTTSTTTGDQSGSTGSGSGSGTPASPTQTQTQSLSTRAGLSYRWGQQNRAGFNWSDGLTRDLAGGDLGSRVRSISGDVSYVPLSGLSLRAQRSISRSSGGTYVSSAVVGNGSFGTGGTGGTGSTVGQSILFPGADAGALQTDTGTQSGLSVVNASSVDDSTTLGISYRPEGAFSIAVSGIQGQYRSTGGIGYLSDQTRRSVSIDATYEVSRQLRFDVRYHLSEIDYLDRSRGQVTNSGWGGSLNWEVSRDFSLRAGYDLSASVSPSFLGGSGNTGLALLTPTAYDNASLEADWKITGRDRLSLDVTSNRSRGALDDSDRITGSIAYSHSIARDMSLGAGGRWVRFLDRLTPLSDKSNRTYRSMSFYAELRLGF